MHQGIYEFIMIAGFHVKKWECSNTKMVIYCKKVTYQSFFYFDGSHDFNRFVFKDIFIRLSGFVF